MDAFETHFTANERWLSVNVESLAMAMQKEFEMKEYQLNDLSPLSYDNVGQQILERLV